nr:MAG TPA: hypothetical protein [Caudoviricetes sp.]DAP10993.1 MAG TPA: hypothetical protein [Caudoviricetes sp.]
MRSWNEFTIRPPCRGQRMGSIFQSLSIAQLWGKRLLVIFARPIVT